MQGAQHDEPLAEPPPDYVVAHIQDALASDGGVAELGVGVAVADGQVVLTGTVSSAEQRERAAAVATAHAGGLPICNDLEVLQLRTPAAPERLA
jgi:osmotically-inducible protein OsmY